MEIIVRLEIFKHLNICSFESENQAEIHVTLDGQSTTFYQVTPNKSTINTIKSVKKSNCIEKLCAIIKSARNSVDKSIPLTQNLFPLEFAGELLELHSNMPN